MAALLAESGWQGKLDVASERPVPRAIFRRPGRVQTRCPSRRPACAPASRARRSNPASIRATSASTLSKRCSGADEAVEGDEHRLAVEVAGKIEDERFEHRLAAAEGRPAAVARDAVVQLPSGAQEAHGIDAVRELASPDRAPCWRSDSRASRPRLSPCTIVPATAKCQPSSVAARVDVALRERGADARGRRPPRRPRSSASTMVTEKPLQHALLGQKLRRAAARLAEMEIVAGDGGADAEPLRPASRARNPRRSSRRARGRNRAPACRRGRARRRAPPSAARASGGTAAGRRRRRADAARRSA